MYLSKAETMSQYDIQYLYQYYSMWRVYSQSSGRWRAAPVCRWRGQGLSEWRSCRPARGCWCCRSCMSPWMSRCSGTPWDRRGRTCYTAPEDKARWSPLAAHLRNTDRSTTHPGSSLSPGFAVQKIPMRQRSGTKEFLTLKLLHVSITYLKLFKEKNTLFAE